MNTLEELEEAEEALEGTLRGEFHFLTKKDVLIFKGFWFNKKEAYEIIEIKTSKTKFRKIEDVLRRYGKFDALQRPVTGKRLYRLRVVP
jgi:hypothetical protein